MGWFFRALAWAGILYEVIRCVVCAVEAVIRKHGDLPKGWSRERKVVDGQLRESCYCPECGPL